MVIFCLPGAFTPTCSSTHLPGYEAKYEEIKGVLVTLQLQSTTNF